MNYMKSLQLVSPTRGELTSITHAGRRVTITWKNGTPETYSECRFYEDAKRLAAKFGDAVNF